MDGFLLVDKPKNITSFDVVRIVRKWSGERKVGHAGTLDKLATGLMILALGKATKSLQYLIGCDKEYEVVARFGVVSETYDAEGPLNVVIEASLIDEKSQEFSKISMKDLELIIKSDFLGEIGQVPPKYSALKIGGKRASDRVRKGEQVEMKIRKVRIDEFKILDFNWPKVGFRIKCSSGTYVRSLVHDLGQKLACGAYVQELRRTKIDKWSVDQSEVLAVEKDFDFENKNIGQYLFSLEMFLKNSKIV